MPEKCQRLQIWGGAHKFRFLVAADSSAAQFALFVEQQVARALSFLDGEGCEGAILVVAVEQTMEVDCADNIHVVKNERLIQAVGILEKEPACLFQAAAGVEQELFARISTCKPTIILACKWKFRAKSSCSTPAAA